jgi:hypothetical protein
VGKEILTQELLKSLMVYREDGTLHWIEETSGFTGEVGVVGINGYKRTTLFQWEWAIHRLVFLYHHGVLPVHPNTVDHINRNKLDNRIENLRDASPSLQAKNQDRRKPKKKQKKPVEWCEEELEELGYNLRTAVESPAKNKRRKPSKKSIPGDAGDRSEDNQEEPT